MTPPHHTWRPRTGFSLVELTAVLTVGVTLALILTPSISNLITNSHVERAHGDCELIAGGVAQFYTDTGFLPGQPVSPNGQPGAQARRVAVLATDGELAVDRTGGSWEQGPMASVASALIGNGPGYARRGVTSKLGWNGPYLSTEVGPDPWNHRYLVNVGAAEAPGTSPDTAGQPRHALWVISAGPNGLIETEFVQPRESAELRGDDIGVRIR